MFRHVVMFKWADETGDDARAAAVAALQAWARTATEFGTVAVGTDAGLREGNYDVAVVGDFADRDTYERYAVDDRHQEMIREHITPTVSARVAVQHEL